ncbi:hypothetical protein [Xanthomarina spongicola]|uniref:NlpE-like protein n=1 Tax=Xanthomarina spongicola TaxID=570520 RepID=A0A316DSB5_9FLAO|nr:hypothetical protein [Xanthomarina spongicola]PWK20342.1 hypothetical protein LX78_00041 [Xanthomarina spongicola]
MKKLFILLLTITTLTSCKNDSKTEDSKVENENTELTFIQGEFVYYADAAVIQTRKDVYGVVIDEKMHELNNQVEPFKMEITDMVPVEIRGKLIPKPEGEEGWPFKVEIKEIIKVSKPDPNKNDVVKLGSQE